MNFDRSESFASSATFFWTKSASILTV